MKDITYYMRFFTLVLTFFFVACSGDDDDKVEPVFPELQKKECTVGQTATIEFEATGNWRLTSSALWCKFVVDNENVNSCSGAAGKQTVNILISDEAAELEKSYKAELTLWIGGAKKVIYEVTRPMLEHEVKLCDREGNIYTEENPCKVLYGLNPPSIYVKANFNWRLIKWPDWMTCEEVAGNAFEVKSTINPLIKEEYQKDPISGNFTFVNEKGVEVAVPIGYDGIPENEIAFSIKSKYGWKFSSDGKTYTGGGLAGESSEAPLNFTVMAKNDAYKVVLLNTAEYMYSHMTSGWFKLDDDTKGRMKLSVVNNTGDSRGGCVMMFPKSVYDAIGDFDQTVIPDGEMSAAYEKYVVLEFEQQGKATMKVTVGDKYGDVLPTSTLLDEGCTEKNLMELYGTKEVYRLILAGAYESLAVNATSFKESYCTLDVQFSEEASGWGDAGAESTWSNGNFSIFGVPADATGQMIITVMDGNGSVHSVLIVQQGSSTFAAKKKLRK